MAVPLLLIGQGKGKYSMGGKGRRELRMPLASGQAWLSNRKGKGKGERCRLSFYFQVVGEKEKSRGVRRKKEKKKNGLF